MKSPFPQYSLSVRHREQVVPSPVSKDFATPHHVRGPASLNLSVAWPQQDDPHRQELFPGSRGPGGPIGGIIVGSRVTHFHVKAEVRIGGHTALRGGRALERGSVLPVPVHVTTQRRWVSIRPKGIPAQSQRPPHERRAARTRRRGSSTGHSPSQRGASRGMCSLEYDSTRRRPVRSLYFRRCP